MQMKLEVDEQRGHRISLISQIHISIYVMFNADILQNATEDTELTFALTRTPAASSNLGPLPHPVPMSCPAGQNHIMSTFIQYIQ